MRNARKTLAVAFIFSFLFSLVGGQAMAADDLSLAAKDQNASGIKMIKTDTNKDGKADRFEYFSRKGILEKVEADSNADGKIDEWGVVESGKLVRVEKDSDFDGKVDKWVEY